MAQKVIASVAMVLCKILAVAWKRLVSFVELVGMWCLIRMVSPFLSLLHRAVTQLHHLLPPVVFKPSRARL